MYAEGGWKPRREPPARGPRPTEREETVLLCFVVLVALVLLIAPIGGGTIVQAVVAAFRRG